MGWRSPKHQEQVTSVQCLGRGHVASEKELGDGKFRGQAVPSEDKVEWSALCCMRQPLDIPSGIFNCLEHRHTSDPIALGGKMPTDFSRRRV